MKRLNACVKNELAVVLFKSFGRFDEDFLGHREPMPLWSGTSAVAWYHSRDLLQSLESYRLFPLINV